MTYIHPRACYNESACCVHTDFTVDQLYHPDSPRANPLLRCEGLRHRLKGGRDHAVCGQFVFPPEESSGAARAHTGHTARHASAHGAFWTLSMTIGLEFQSPGFN